MNKKFSIRDMSVKAKIVMFSFVMLLFMVVIAGVGLFASNSINKARARRYDNYAMSEYNLSEAFTNFCNIKVRVRNMPIMYFAPGVDIDFADQETKIDNYEKVMNEYFAKFEEKLDTFEDPAIKTKYDEVRASLDKWMTNTREDMALIHQGIDSSDSADYDQKKVEEACTDLMQNGRVIADEAEAELTELVELIETESDKNGQEVNTELTTLTAILIIVAVIAFIITFAYAILLIKLITLPVNKLSEAAKKLAVGDIEVDVAKTSNDDLGVLMDNFSEMVSAIKDQADIARHLSSGNMTIQVTPRSEKDVLGKALKTLAEDQNKTLSNVKESTMQVTVGAEQVASASQALAQGATEQASALEEVKASMGEIAERTKQNASEATEADQLVGQVKDKALEGNSQMKQMISAMNEINEASETIAKIMKVIDDIAFQTNILALNAAVEAARAGVHGKGFAVVAEEVRNLAGKSANAAGETSEMINDAIHKIGNGTKLAEATASSLDEIVNSIESVVTLVNTIAHTSNEQASAIEEIDQAIDQVSQVVQTNSATSEECASSSEELSNQAANLRDMMSKYTLSGGGGGFSSNGSTDSFIPSADSFNEQIISLDGDFGKY